MLDFNVIMVLSRDTVGSGGSGTGVKERYEASPVKLFFQYPDLFAITFHPSVETEIRKLF